MDKWLIEHRERPFTINTVYGRWHPRVRAKHTKEWREAFAWLALDAKIPHLEQIEVIATPLLSDRRAQDTGACVPAVKAAIDGLVDAGVVEDDDPKHVLRITFQAPVLAHEYDALRLEVRDLAIAAVGC